MERFLRAFASDQLQVIEVTETRSPKRQRLIDESYKLHTELEQKLNTEEKELLERLLDTNADENTLYAEDKFIRGYRLGVLMTMEVFAGQDRFFYEEGQAEKGVGRKSKDNLLDIFVKTRTVKTLDEAVGKSNAYQETLKRQDKAFETLEKAGLSKEQKGIVDRAISAANDCGATYGAVAYELGLQDGIKLMSELKEIK